MITKILNSEYPQVSALWEESVRVTHHFLKEEDILFFRSEMSKYLDAVELVSLRDTENRILGFMGTSEYEIEMLFVHPDAMGKGVGTALIKYVIGVLGKLKVSVNEQNENALQFYKKNGFSVTSRSDLDSSGKPYPIMHMELK